LRIGTYPKTVTRPDTSNDIRGSVYAAITHLEAAEIGSLQRVEAGEDIKLPRGFRLMSNAAAFRAHEVRYHWFCLMYIYVSMATLYYKVGEKRLAYDAIQKLMEATKKWNAFSETVEWTPGHYLNPGNWRYLQKALPIEGEQVDAFFDIINTWDISDADLA